MKEQIGNIYLDLTDYNGHDDYSDGPVEDELLEIVKTADKSQYMDFAAQRHSWPILYHLSEQRWNIIESIPIKKTDKVLEIGSGCGAITGALARKADSVTCIELSKKRSMINAYRNKDFDNIKIKVGNFKDVYNNINESFDIITLIGVFEYAQGYIDSKNPYIDFLEMIKKLLVPGGGLVIAIENKYGLKYWAGCKEDHTQQFFVGLEGYPGINRARTFSKDKLKGLIETAGYTDIKFYYPYPDYKFVRKVFTDDYLPQKGELQNNSSNNFDGDRLELFNEDLVFDSLIEDNMFPFFANSFLVTATI